MSKRSRIKERGWLDPSVQYVSFLWHDFNFPRNKIAFELYVMWRAYNRQTIGKTINSYLGNEKWRQTWNDIPYRQVPVIARDFDNFRTILSFLLIPHNQKCSPYFSFALFFLLKYSRSELHALLSLTFSKLIIFNEIQ